MKVTASKQRLVTHIDVGVSDFALPGQSESGDLWVAKNYARGALMAVIDGCGHGSEAASAARIARAELQTRPQEGVISLVNRCHERLKRTRGVVMSLASFNLPEHTMTWLGVGNVEGILFRRDPHVGYERESLFLRPGVVGYRLPLLQATMVQVNRGDLLVLATDGIRADFSDKLPLTQSPQRITDHICRKFGKGNDDGLVLVARYLG